MYAVGSHCWHGCVAGLLESWGLDVDAGFLDEGKSRGIARMEERNVRREGVSPTGTAGHHLVGQANLMSQPTISVLHFLAPEPCLTSGHDVAQNS